MSGLSFPAVTGVTAGAIALVQIALTLWVGGGRFKFGVGLGDGGQEAMNRRIRMHGNLTENAPLVLILLGLVELTGAWPHMVPVIGALFVLCRIAHPIGMSMWFGPGPNPFRFVGAAGTLLITIVLAAVLLITAWPRLG